MGNFRDTILAIGLAVACCALPILLVSGVSIGGGVLFGETVLVVAGLAGIAYAVFRVARGRRRA